MSYKILIAIILLNLSSAVYAINLPYKTNPSSKAPTSTDNYQHCFQNSTWVVPPKTLLAYLYDNADTTPVSDQTVWVISGYNQGYFTGQSYSAINNSILSQKYLIGSVTSDGKVLITFYSGTSISTSLISGTGTLNTKSSGQCYFIMQMNSGQNGVSGLTHWSYMVAANPGDALYENLPSTNMSVPQFLARF